MSRFIRAALVVGASALAAWAISRYSFSFKVVPLAEVDDDHEGIVSSIRVDRLESKPAPREEVLARIQARVDDFHILPPSDKIRFQSGEGYGLLVDPDIEVEVEFVFTETDPLALGVHLRNEHAEAFFLTSREEVLAALAGEEPTPGPIVVSRSDEDEDDFYFHVETDDGYRTLSVSASMVETFLAATNALIPLGGEIVDWMREAQHLGLDPSQLHLEDRDE